jgi:pyruvate formate-lyase/glycerol dehydratase family glycyl radical enzyme
MSDRIKRMQKHLQVEKYPLCIEKSLLMTESYKQTEGEPQIIRMAKIMAHVMDNITIFIEDDELIVGNAASKPNGVETAFFESVWPLEEVAALKQEAWTISDGDIDKIKSMNEYWKNKTIAYRAGQLLDEERLLPFMRSGVILPPWESVDKGWGGFGGGGMGIGPNLCLLAPDFAKAIDGGLNKIIKEAEEELRNLRMTGAEAVTKAYYLHAVIIANKAAIHFAHRFSELAKDLALKEKNTGRKKELEKIADICKWVPANPARNFHEAIQSYWFTFLIINPNPTVSISRFDQFMYPYYKKDITGNKITDEEVIELLSCLRIKDMQILPVASRRGQREKNAGLAKWHNMIIGGVTSEGKDATNELSYLILETAKQCQTPHHTITMRVHEGTPEPLMLKAIEVVKTGIGMPAFIGDKSYIEYLLGQGVPIESARDYMLAGCLDASLPGQSRISAYMMIITPLIFEFFLNNGIEPRTGRQLGPRTGDITSFKSFDELKVAWKKHLEYFMGLVAEWDNIFIRVRADVMPHPFESALMIDGIKAGKDMLERTFPLENGATLNAVGLINVTDSLAAIKKLVFDDKKITMKLLKEALDANWKNHEDIRKMCLSAPKYGNDDDYVDSIARELYKFWADTAGKLDTALGGKHKPAAISISAQWPGGALTGATPDGRFAGDCLADGTMSAERGMDIHGPIALIKSAMKIDQIPYQATLLNVKFHPDSLKTTSDMKKLSDLIKTYFSMGGKHMQFNVVDRATLKEAQINPEQHRDLIVRVAGYSAYFVELGSIIQDEVVARTEHDFK